MAKPPSRHVKSINKLLKHCTYYKFKFKIIHKELGYPKQKSNFEKKRNEKSNPKNNFIDYPHFPNSSFIVYRSSFLPVNCLLRHNSESCVTIDCLLNYFPGNPRILFEIIFNWTSEVPPSIEFALVRHMSLASLPSSYSSPHTKAS